MIEQYGHHIIEHNKRGKVMDKRYLAEIDSRIRACLDVESRLDYVDSLLHERKISQLEHHLFKQKILHDRPEEQTRNEINKYIEKSVALKNKMKLENTVNKASAITIITIMVLLGFFLMAGKPTFTGLFALNESADDLHLDVDFSLKDASDAKLKSKVKFIDSEDDVVYENKGNGHTPNIKKGKYRVVVEQPTPLIRSMEFEDFEFNPNSSDAVHLDDPPDKQGFTDLYVIDLTGLNFTKVKVVASNSVGDTLYKCKEWNFTERACHGEWKLVQHIVPGLDYEFYLTPGDPALATSGGKFSEGFESGLFSTNGWTNDSIVGTARWVVTTTTPLAGTRSARISSSASTQANMYLNLSTEGWRNITVVWKWSTSGTVTTINASYWNGAAWVLMKTKPASSVESNFQFNLSGTTAVENQTATKFRLRFMGRSTSAAARTMYVDDVNVTAIVPIRPAISTSTNRTTSFTAVINWTTNFPSNTTVQYGTTTSLGTTRRINNAVTAHNVTLTGLSPATKYFYNISSCYFGNCKVNGTFKLKTKNATSIGAVNSSGTTLTSTVINWTTNFPSNTTVQYGTTTSLGTTRRINNAVTAHNVTLTGLSVHTIYFYNVSSCSLFGCQVNGSFTFRTRDTLPVASNVTISSTYGTNRATENLSVQWAATDANGDRVVNITDWRRNGSSITLLNSRFEPDGRRNGTDYSSGNLTRYFRVNTNDGPEYTKTGGYKRTGAWKFPGTGTPNRFVQYNFTQHLNITGNKLTIMAWANFTDVSSYNMLAGISYPTSTPFNGFILLALGTGIIFDVQAAAGVGNACRAYAVTTTPALAAGRWYHLTGEYNGTHCRVFLNGVEQNSSKFNAGGNVVTPNKPFIIGGYAAQDANSVFNGFIDDVRLYNYTLSDKAILDIARNGTDRIISQELRNGQTWQAAVTPNDGFFNGATKLSNNITIGSNNAPNVTSISLNSTHRTNLTTDNLTAYWSVSDPDNNKPIINITDWRITGRSIALVNMPFENHSTSNRNATDYSTFKNNGSVIGARFNRTSGFNGYGAYEFVKSNDRIVIRNSTKFNYSMPFTVAVRAKPRVITGGVYPSPISQGLLNVNAWFIFINHDIGNKWTFRTNFNAVNYDVSSNVAASAGTWQYLVGVYNLTSILIYVDGVLQNTAAMAGPQTYTRKPTLIGLVRNFDDASFTTPFNGTIDDVMIFNRSLSAEQIRLLNKTNSIISQKETIAGQRWQVAITPNDKATNGLTKISNNVTIRDTIAITRIYPNASNKNETIASSKTNVTLTRTPANITFNVSARLLDSSSKITFRWFVNKVFKFMQTLASGLQSAFSQLFSTEGKYNVTVVVNGTDNSINDTFTFKLTVISRIVFDNNSSKNATSKASIKFNHTVGTGSNRILIVGTGSRNDGGERSVSSITYGGTALTKIAHQDRNGFGNLARAEMWYLVNPPSGKAIVNVTWDGTSAHALAGAISLFNVNQLAPLGKLAQTGGCPATTLNIATEYNNSWVVDTINFQDKNPFTVGAGQIDRWHTFTSIEAAMSTENTTTNGTYTMSWTPEGGCAGHIAQEIKAFTSLSKISNVRVYNITNRSAIVNWTTNDFSNTSVNYGLTVALGTKSQTNNAVITHSRSLVGLRNDSVYYFNVTSCNSATSCLTNGTFSFRTASSPINTSGFTFRRNICINNTGTVPWTENYSAWIILDTTDTARFQADGDDIVVTSNKTGHNVELNRRMYQNSTQNTFVFFRTGRIIASNKKDCNYNLFYGNTTKSNPSQNGSKVFLFFDDFERFANNADLTGSNGYNVSGNGAPLFEARTNAAYHSNRGARCQSGGGEWVKCWRDMSKFSRDGNYSFGGYFIAEAGSSRLDVMIRNDGTSSTSDGYLMHWLGFTVSLVSDGIGTTELTKTVPSHQISMWYFQQFAGYSDRIWATMWNVTNEGEKIFNVSKIGTTVDEVRRPWGVGSIMYGTVFFDDIFVREFTGGNPYEDLNYSFGAEVSTNHVPVINNLVLNSTHRTNLTTDNLTVYWTVSDVDNNKPLINITDWRVNGKSITVLNMPFEADGVRNGTDYSSFRNNATTVNGSVLWNKTGGRVGAAYMFDGKNDFIHVPNSSTSLAVRNSITLEAWIKPSFINSDFYKTILEKFNDDYGIYLSSPTRGPLFFFETSANTYEITSFTSISINAWHHVVATYNGSMAKIYVDGVLRNQSAATGTISNRHRYLRIGGNTGDSYFNGTIDEVRVYNRSLSPQQVYVNYLAGNLSRAVTRYVAEETTTGERWQVAITPNDQIVNGVTKLSNNVTIRNAIDITRIYPNASNKNETIASSKTNVTITRTQSNVTFNVSASLAGSSSKITFRWFLDNVLQFVQTLASGLTSSFTKLLNLTSGFHNVKVVVNGTDSSINDTFTFRVNITNIGPTVTNVILNSTHRTNLTTDNLTVYWSISDISSNKPLINITDWRVNGRSFAVVNMPFENHSKASTNATDYSTYKKNGTVSGARFNLTGGFNGKGAYRFDGTDDWIRVADNNVLDSVVNDMTIALWVKPASTQNQYANIMDRHNCAQQGFTIQQDSFSTNSYYFSVIVGGTSYCFASAATTLTANTWQHFVVQRSGDKVYHYLNGNRTVTCTANNGSLTASSAQLTIGASGENGACASREFTGFIDDVRIYNKTLSVEQIAAIYRNRTDLIVSQETSAGERWQAAITGNDRMDDGATKLSNNLTIRSAAPSVTNVILNSSHRTNFTTDNLTAYWSVSDADGGKIVNITDWRINGKSITVLNMPFEADGRKNGTDYSTFGNNVTTVTGNPRWNKTSGYIGGAYRFDGLDDNLRIPDSNSLDLRNNLTLEFWVNPGAQQVDYADILSKHSSGLAGYVLEQDGANDNVFLFAWGSGGAFACGNPGNNIITLTPNVFQYVAIVKNGTKVVAYKNGIQTGSCTGAFATIAPNGDDVYISRWSSGGGRPFNGTIDELKLYNRSLSIAEILYHNLSRYDKIAHQETKKNERWEAVVTPNDLTQDGTRKFSNNLTIRNKAPGTPTLIKPNNGNNTNTNLTVIFTWSNVTDADGDPFTYQLNLTSKLCADQLFTGISSATYTINNLRTRDVCGYYNWSVRGYDGTDFGTYSSVFNFSILPYVNIYLIQNISNFGNMVLFENNDTSDDNPLPFVVESGSNVLVNVNIRALDELWDRSGLGNNSFRFKIDVTTEPNSFNFTGSQTTYIPVKATAVFGVRQLKYVGSNDTAEIDFNVTVPDAEPAGRKSSNVIVEGVQS
jgi:hypothetical protein